MASDEGTRTPRLRRLCASGIELALTVGQIPRRLRSTGEGDDDRDSIAGVIAQTTVREGLANSDGHEARFGSFLRDIGATEARYSVVDLPEDIRVIVMLQCLWNLLGVGVVVAEHDAHDRHIRVCDMTVQVRGQTSHCLLTGRDRRRVFSADEARHEAQFTREGLSRFSFLLQQPPSTIGHSCDTVSNGLR